MKQNILKVFGFAALMALGANAWADAVAKIGETEYATLEEAFAKVKVNETVKLLCDMDFTGRTWTPVNLVGSFDGQNHTIRNLSIDLPTQCNVGFFSKFRDQEGANKKICNVTFENADIKGSYAVGVVVGGNSEGTISNVTVRGSIKVEGVSGDGDGYARVGGVVGSWCYKNLIDVTVDGQDKTASYVKGGGSDGRYVGGLVGHSDDVRLFENCAVRNVRIEGGWLCGGLCGPGPADGVCKNCTVENVDISCSYSGGLFGWFFDSTGARDDQGVLDGITIRNVTFGSYKCGTVGGYSMDDNVVVKNLTVEGVNEKNLLHYVAFVTVGTDDYYYSTVQLAIDNAATLDAITVRDSAAKIPEDYELYEKGDLWGLREKSPSVRVGENEYVSISSALAASSGDVEIVLIGDSASGCIQLTDTANSQITSLTIDLNGFTLTDNGGDAFKTKNRTITIRDSSQGKGYFNHIGTDDCVWLYGDTGGVVLESGRFHLVDKYGLAYVSSPATTDMLVIKGGTYNLNPANDAKGRNQVPEGFESVDNGDGTWLVRAKPVSVPEVKVEVDPDTTNKTTAVDKEGQPAVIPEEKKDVVEQQTQTQVEKAIEEIVNNRPAQEKTDTGVTAEEILTVTTGETTVVKEPIKEGILADAKTKGATPEVQAKLEDALNSKDVSSKINIKLEATGVTVDTTEEQVEVTVTKAVFDVTPLATVTVVTGTEQKAETNEFTTVISNDELAGKTFSVRLPLSKSFVNNVRVVHESEGYPTEEYIVASQVGADGARFCEVLVAHFSTLTAYDTKESVPVKYESTDVLGIIRRNDAGSGKESYENAIAVPWASRAANGDIVSGMTVADLITANGLGEGDELHVWIPDAGTTHTGVVGGTEVSRKGTYAIFRWDAAQQKWTGAKDMDSGDIAVGTDYLIPRGAAVWYKRATATSGDYTIVGLVSNVCETAVTVGTSSEPVMTLLVNPFPEAVDAAKIAGADGDELIVNRTGPTGANMSYVRKGGAWGQMVTTETVIGSRTIKTQAFQSVEAIPVANGQSFWYVSRGGSPTVSWKAIKQ